MTKGLNSSIFKSVIYSGFSSASSYILLIVVAQLYPKESTSYYLYLVTIGVLLVLLLDFASEQSLVHYSKSKDIDIYSSWVRMCVIKLCAISIIIPTFIVFSYFNSVEVPFMAIFMLVPVFYLGPVFEYYAQNIVWVKIVLFERLFLLIIVLVLSSISYNINYIIYSYFSVSFLSLFIQYFYVKIFIKPKLEIETKFRFVQYTSAYFALYLVVVSQLVYGNISRIIIDAKIGAIAFASITLALQIVNAISIIQSQVDRHIRPIIIQSIHDENWIELKFVSRRYAMHYLLPIVLGCIIMILFSTQIIYLLFGPKWTEAASALRFASPLVFTIACMRFIDILVVPLRATKMNLLVNIVSAIFLFLLLWFNPRQDLESYVFLIVLSQALHVAFMAAYVYGRAGYIMRQSV